MLMDTRPPRGGDEPWRGEPNLVRWRDLSTGYQCVIARGPMGALCGYVRVPRNHPWHGKPFSRRCIERRIAVHGGLTFSGRLRSRVMKRGHWFGFDCGHFCDLMPAMVALRATLPPALAESLRIQQTGRFAEVYRTIEYVRAECTALAQQLAEKGSR